MNINVTFIIQIINFIIVYMVLHRFLFGPVLTSISQKKEKKAVFEKDIKAKEDELIKLEQKKRKAIVSFQAHATKAYPFVASPKCDTPLDVESKIMFEDVDTKKMKKELKSWLLSKVPHGY